MLIRRILGVAGGSAVIAAALVAVQPSTAGAGCRSGDNCATNDVSTWSGLGGAQVVSKAVSFVDVADQVTRNLNQARGAQIARDTPPVRKKPAVPCWQTNAGYDTRLAQTAKVDPAAFNPKTFNPAAYGAKKVSCGGGGGAAPGQPGAPAAPPPPPDPVMLARSASARLKVGSPRVSMSPQPPIKSLVGLETWLWISQASWRNYSTGVSLGGATVRVRFEPTQVAWTMGDGSTVRCGGPGKAWSNAAPDATTDCGHLYRHTSVNAPGGKYAVRTTVRYVASWSCTGRCLSTGGDLPDRVSPAASIPVTVGERQSVVTD